MANEGCGWTPEANRWGDPGKEASGEWWHLVEPWEECLGMGEDAPYFETFFRPAPKSNASPEEEMAFDLEVVIKEDLIPIEHLGGRPVRWVYLEDSWEDLEGSWHDLREYYFGPSAFYYVYSDETFEVEEEFRIASEPGGLEEGAASEEINYIDLRVPFNEEVKSSEETEVTLRTGASESVEASESEGAELRVPREEPVASEETVEVYVGQDQEWSELEEDWSDLEGEGDWSLAMMDYVLEETI